MPDKYSKLWELLVRNEDLADDMSLKVAKQLTKLVKEIVADLIIKKKK